MFISTYRRDYTVPNIDIFKWPPVVKSLTTNETCEPICCPNTYHSTAKRTNESCNDLGEMENGDNCDECCSPCCNTCCCQCELCIILRNMLSQKQSDMELNEPKLNKPNKNYGLTDCEIKYCDNKEWTGIGPMSSLIHPELIPKNENDAMCNNNEEVEEKCERFLHCLSSKYRKLKHDSQIRKHIAPDGYSENCAARIRNTCKK